MQKHFVIKEQPRTRENEYIELFAQNLACMSVDILHTNFGFTLAKLNNFSNFVFDQKTLWLNSEKDTNELIDYSMKKNPYIREAIKRVPFSQMVAVAGMKRPPVTVDARRLLEAAMGLCCAWIDEVLKKHYKMSREWREAFFKCLTWDRYNSKEDLSETNFRSCFNLWADKKQNYNRESIRRKFIEEYNYDIVKGETISGKGSWAERQAAQ